jgi:uncharacterized protein YkwD
MPTPGATDAGKVSRQRRMLGTLALVVCLCTPIGVATAFASASRASGAPLARITMAHSKAGRPHHRRTRHSVTCAKRSSFHSSGGHVRRKHHPTHCAKQHAGKQHATGRKRAGTHHSKSPKRTDHRPKRHRSSKPAHAGDACPGADLRPEQENIETIRSATLCLVDQERTGRGEVPLQPNARLQQAAQAHTENMAFDGYFEHNGPGGDTPLSRMIAAGYIYSSRVGYEIGENIGWGSLSLSTPREIVAAWMASPGHRANILDAHFRDTAIGVSTHLPSSLGRGQTGAIYTQDFGVIITA